MKPRLNLPIILLGIAAPLPEAAADELLLRVRPEPGVVARAVRDSAYKFRFRQPFGPDLELPNPRGPLANYDHGPELREIDIDFDGHTDFAVHFPNPQVDDPLQILRYLPQERRYETLTAPLVAGGAMICDWRDAVLDHEEHSLLLSCRDGLSSVTETVRFDDVGNPWVQSRLVEGAWRDENQYPYIDLFGAFSRWDETGREEEVVAMTREGQPINLIIPVSQVFLHKKPLANARSQAYLVRGDRVTLLDRKTDWLRIRYDSRSGSLDQWIFLPEAFDLGTRFEPAETSPDPTLTLSAGRLENGREEKNTLDPFPIILTNEGGRLLSLRHVELHLIFRHEDWHMTHQLYYAGTIALGAGEHRVLEEGPVILTEDGYSVRKPLPDEFTQYAPAYPLDLPVRRYDVRVALTSPDLAGPIYSTNEVPVFHPDYYILDDE